MTRRAYYPKIPQDEKAKYAKIRLTTKQRYVKRILVAAFYFFYILVGAYIFSLLEHPLEKRLCDEAIEEIEIQIDNYEKTKEFLTRELIFPNATLPPEPNITTALFEVSTSAPKTTPSTQNFTVAETTELYSTFPAPARFRRQVNIDEVILEYSFCTHNETGAIIMELPDDDLLMIMRSSHEDFFSHTVFISGINEENKEFENADEYKSLFGGLKTSSIKTGLRFVNDFAQLTLKWSGSTAICFERLILKLPNGMQADLIAKEKRNAKYIWFSTQCDDFIDREEYEISTNCRQTSNYFFDYHWTSWDDWGSCSSSCGLGTRQRSRSCGQKKQNYNEFAAIPSERFTVLPVDEVRLCVNLEEDYIENQPCLNSTCPIITQWSNWSDCSETCGAGVIYRNRKCEVPGDECLGGEFEAESCETNEECATAGSSENVTIDNLTTVSTTLSPTTETASECVCEEPEVKEIIKEVDKVIEVESEECEALKRQGLPPCVYEIMQNMTYLNGKSNLLFDQSATFSFTLDNVRIPYALDGNVTDMLIEISKNLTVITQNLTLFSYNLTDPVFDNITIGETQIWEFALTRSNLEAGKLSESILSSVSGIIRNEVDLLVDRANLTVNQSIELIDVKQGDRLYTIAKLKKTRDDVGNITCEVDSLFERFIVDFLVDEPKRIKHIINDVNSVIDELEEAKSQSIYFMRALSTEFNKNLTSAVESEMRMAEELKQVELILINKEKLVEDQTEKIDTCGANLESTLEKYLDCRVPKRKINGSIYGTDSYLQPEKKIHDSLQNFVPSYGTENGTFICPNFWNYKNSLFYVFNSIAVLGSKDTEPFTTSGKVFKVFYSLVGICAFLALYFSIASFVLAKINNYADKLGKNFSSDKKYRIHIGIVFCLISFWVCFLVLIPSNAISQIEGWSFGDSVYFLMSSSFFSSGTDTGRARVNSFTMFISKFIAQKVPSFLHDKYLLSIYRIVIIIWNFMSNATVFVIFRYLFSISRGIVKARKREFEESIRQKHIVERNVHSNEVVKHVPIPKPRRPRNELREEEITTRRNQYGNNRVRYMHNIHL